MWFLRSSVGVGKENPKIRLAPREAVGEGRSLGIVSYLQRTLRLSLYLLCMCLIVVYCFKNHHIAEGSAYAAHENHHIGDIHCRYSELGAASNCEHRADNDDGNHSTSQTDTQGCPLSPCRVDAWQTNDDCDDHSMHCTSSYPCLFARTQGGRKAELQGQVSEMTGVKGKGGKREK